MNRYAQITNCAISPQLQANMTRIPELLELSDADAKDVAYTHRDIKPEEIDLEWIQKMVNRLFTELEKQLKSVEKFAASAEPVQTAKFFKNAQTIKSMQFTLASLFKLKTQVDGVLAIKTTRKPREAREKIAKQLAGQVERNPKASVSGKVE